jgi:hypothetical protein
LGDAALQKTKTNKQTKKPNKPKQTKKIKPQQKGVKKKLKQYIFAH